MTAEKDSRLISSGEGGGERETLLDRSRRIMGEQIEMLEDSFPVGVEKQR